MKWRYRYLERLFTSLTDFKFATRSVSPRLRRVRARGKRAHGHANISFFITASNFRKAFALAKDQLDEMSQFRTDVQTAYDQMSGTDQTAL